MLTPSNRRLSLAAFMVVILTNAGARADQIISTLGSWNGSSSIGEFGSVPSGATPTYGETFTTPTADTVLTSVTYELRNQGGAAIPFRADVFAWNGTNVVGPALFTSAAMSLSTAATFQAITVNTNSLALVTGQQYVALFTTIGEGGSSFAYSDWGGYLPDSTYTGGTFVYNNGSTFASLATPTWGVGNFGDLAFSLSFTSSAIAVPEPSTVMGAIGGVMMVGGTYWRKRRVVA